MYVHATGTIADPGKLEPYWPEETRVLAELHAEGIVKSLFRLSDRLGVSLRDRLNGHEYTVRSRYLVGARSAIAEELGLPIEGVMGRVGTIYTLFKADLTRYGDPDVEVEIEIATTWQINQAWATQYGRGRVFCGSDAMHRHPPSSRLGSNTSIQDAFNLAWKLAYGVRGWAGPGLLESYSAERALVGAPVVARANQSRVDYGPVNAAFRTEGQADPVAAGLAKLRDPRPRRRPGPRSPHRRHRVQELR